MANKEEKKADKDEKYPEMEYRMLGGTGLKVSVLGFGTMSFNNYDQSKALMKAARKGGVNFFDNAELYGEPCGEAEVLFGKALKELEKEDAALWRRTDLVITTKLYFGVSDGKQPNKYDRPYGVNELGLSRKHLMEGIKTSLQRLQLDYVDVIYAHRYDELTPMLEIVSGFTEIIKKGYAYYWGTSMWTAQKITEAYWIAKVYNLIPPVVEQPIYNMFARQYVEVELAPMYSNPYQIGTTIWSPLDGGILTGKYNQGIPKESRIGNDRLAVWFKGHFEATKAVKLQKVEELISIAEELKTTVTNLSLAWCLKNSNVTVVLLGASKAEQLKDNFECLDVARKLKDDTMKKIDDILKNKPAPDSQLQSPRRPLKSTI